MDKWHYYLLASVLLLLCSNLFLLNRYKKRKELATKHWNALVILTRILNRCDECKTFFRKYEKKKSKSRMSQT